LQRGGVIVQTSEVIAWLSSDNKKSAARPDFAVRLQPNCTDPIICVRIERICQARRGIEPGDAVARLSPDVGKDAAHHNLAVRLHRD
jgi:hypothetical protein